MPKKRLERTGVMLATPLDDKLLSKFPEVNFVQPKLNGERCRAEWSNIAERHVLFSSYGNVFAGLNHIQDELSLIFPEISVDGELYVHGWTREKIHSIASRKKNSHKDAGQLHYTVFDIISDDIQYSRVLALTRISNLIKQQSVHIIKTLETSKAMIPRVAENYLAEGYEGLILRHYSGLYESKRSRFLAKFKPSKTDRYIIIKTLEEIDKDGYPKNTLGALRVKDHSGNEFNVGTGNALTKLSRKHLWERRDFLPGRFAVVKHSLIYTVGGYPTCTSLVEVE